MVDGSSAALAAPMREGFKGLLSSVGLVVGGEVSRLSRTDKDGCQPFNTLIADARNLYDLNRLDDRLGLGIEGTLSVVELETFASVRRSSRSSHPTA